MEVDERWGVRSMKRVVWKGDWPIPKTVKLPGLLIKVVVVPADEARLREMPYGIWVYEHASQHAEIHINGAHPLPLQRYILWHELQHAVIEAVDVMIEKYPNDVATASMLTMQLKENNT